MTTLYDLWEENKAPFKVVYKAFDSSRQMTIVGKAPNEGFYGFDDHGVALSFTYTAKRKDWILYEEPKPKLKAWLLKYDDYDSKYIYFFEEEKLPWKSKHLGALDERRFKENWTRAEWLDQP